MKRSLLCFLFIASQIFQMHAQTPSMQINSSSNVSIISPNQIFIDIMNEHLTAAYAQAKPEQMLTRKKSNVAAIILNGIAQACMHLGYIFGASDKRAKHQGVCNVAGTVFSVASQLSAHSEKPLNASEQIEIVGMATPENNDLDKEQMTSRLADLTNNLVHELDNQPLKSPNAFPETLTLIRSMPTSEAKQEIVATILATPEHAKQYLIELFSALRNYIDANSPMLVEIVKEKITAYLDNKQGAVQAENTDAKTVTVTPNVLTPGMIIHANTSKTYSPELLDYLTNHFITTLQTQLKEAIGADESTTTTQVVDWLQEAVVHLYCA